jgi:hypothetical protein
MASGQAPLGKYTAEEQKAKFRFNTVHHIKIASFRIKSLDR